MSTAQALLEAFDGGTQVAPLTDARLLNIDDGYAIAAQIHDLRKARGENTVGRKIGFTNRTIWPIYNVDAPVWGWVWDSGLHDIPASGEITLPPQAELRIEPEIVFGFAQSPDADMTDADLWACVDWVAHGFEIVTSAFPGWRFTAPDTAAGQAMHASLWIGPRLPANQVDPADLARFGLTLQGPNTRLSGTGADVLGGPLDALRHLLSEIPRMPGAGPVAKGEVVTTGTLTDAPLIASGQDWRSEINGLALDGLAVTLV